MKTKILSWYWAVWAFLEPPTDDNEFKCIHRRCSRPWIYDSLCRWHWHREMAGKL
jgi:hypothetical protein